MPDQAHDLRQLAVLRRAAPTRVGRPALLAVAGGKGGVGSSTVALNLAASAAKSGLRTLFVDADPRGIDAAAMPKSPCRGRRVETAAFFNRQFFFGRWSVPAGQCIDRLEGDDAPEADLAIIDAGNSLGQDTLRLCRRADAVLLVTTPSAAAVMNTFAAIRLLTNAAGNGEDGAAANPVAQINLLVNMAENPREAKTVYYRLAWAARRLLGLRLRSAGRLKTNYRPLPDDKNMPVDMLNFRALSVDKVRELLVAELMSNWRNRVEFDGQSARAFAQPLEMDF